jgi:hypothetical protein
MSSGSVKRGFFFLLLVFVLANLGTACSDAADHPSPDVPATIDVAAKVIDLSTLPLVAGAKPIQQGRIAGLTYTAPGTVKSAYEFHRKQLLDRKWKGLPGGYVSDETSNATFARDGFLLSLMVFPSGKDGAMVTITNHGNVKLDKLPLPPGTKPLFAGPVSAMFVTESPVKQTAEACSKALLDKGWQPYGVAGDQQFFKQNAIRLSAFITAASAQGGKTVIQYSTELMSADLPAPADAMQLSYSDSPAQLSFDTVAAQKEIADFYRKTLGKTGWKATTDEPIKIDFRHELIFRNPSKEMLTLQLTDVEGKSRILLRYQTAAEIAELDKQFKEAMARKKADANKPLPKLAVAIPTAAVELKQDKKRIEFKLPAGKAKSIVESWRKQFVKDGWKEGTAVVEDMAGSISFDKGDQHLTLTYTNTGFLPAEITLQATGLELEKAAEKE